MNTVSLKAYAKLNLSLDIVGRRADGHHLISTVMQTVSLHDVVTLSETDTGAIEVNCSDSSVPAGRENLAHAAAGLFFELTGLACRGLRIMIEKNIPSGAGMGGASTDAAAVLRGLRQMYRPKMDYHELVKTSLTLGADVPFCLTGGTCLCEGIGEVLTPLSAIPDCRFVIVKPNFSQSTREAYALFDRADIGSLGNTGPMVEAIKAGDMSGICRAVSNVMELSLDNSEVRAVKSSLIANGAQAAAMTGSGSAVFGLFFDHESARRAAKEIATAEPYLFVNVAAPLYLVGSDAPAVRIDYIAPLSSVQGDI